MSPLILFLPESPLAMVLILAVVFLLFGSSKLPQLARALGQSKRAFEEGLQEKHEKERKEVQADSRDNR